MDMNQVYATLDEMFASGRNAQAEAYLIECMQSAGRQEDYQSLIMLLNEMIGYCRETGQKEKSIGYASQVIELMQSLGLEGTVAYATTLLNVANALRAAGKLQEAYQFYMEVFPIYEANLRPDDFYYASLYNNLSLLLQEMGDYEKAIECLQKALVLAEHTQGKEFEVYVTHANIASTLCKLAQQEKEKERQLGITFERPQLARSYEIATEAAAEAEEAVEGFIHEQVKDQHMAAALTAYADAALLLGQYRDAMRYLKDAAQMVEQTVGRTEAYERIEEKYRYAKKLDDQRKQAMQADAGYDAGQEPDDEKAILPQEAQTWAGRGCSVAADDAKGIPHTKRADRGDDAGKEAGIAAEASDADGGHISGLELAEGYYETYGKKMLFDHFGDYLDRIAVGLCGPGSDCLGFDDVFSEDHDFGPGFCMWLTKETYDAIGERLQEEYEKLPGQYRGYQRVDNRDGQKRHGVFIIEEFFESILGRRGLPATTQDWLGIPEDALLAATSGMIFSDPEGIFTEMQVYLAGGYPEEARRRLIAQHMTLFSQYGQYNYARMLARGDRAAATLMVVKATEHAMHLCYLFNREYAPHDKWLLKGMEEFEILPMAEDVMTALLNNPDVHKEEEGVDRIALIEKLAGMFLQEAKNQGLIPGDAVDTYLAGYGRQIAYGDGAGEKMQATKDSPDPDGSSKERMDGAGAETTGDGYVKQEPEDAKPAKEDESGDGYAKQDPADAKNAKSPKEDQPGDGYSKQELVDAVVRMEFEAFDSVKNEGGRAECQDDWTTFEIMRKSQYLTWTEEMLRQYIVDFQLSMKRGWNPITEKYGRMMESTAPEQYAKIRDSFPVIDADKKEIIEEIVRVQIGWMEDFAARYPRVAREARVIHTSEDTPYVTSYETYLRGEISTYSDEMLMLYGRFIAALAQEGKNLAEMTMLNTVHLYGYKDLAAAEEKMW